MTETPEDGVQFTTHETQRIAVALFWAADRLAGYAAQYVKDGDDLAAALDLTLQQEYRALALRCLHPGAVAEARLRIYSTATADDLALAE